MPLLGGAAMVKALTGRDVNLAPFLIPWGVILYTAAGGLKATCMASYLHTPVIFLVLVVSVYIAPVKATLATYLFGGAGSVMMAIMLFMAVTPTGSAEGIAVPSLVAYDISKTCSDPDPHGLLRDLPGPVPGHCGCRG